MDRIDAMKVFVAALDEGSLAAAGRKLGVPLPNGPAPMAEGRLARQAPAAAKTIPHSPSKTATAISPRARRSSSISTMV